VFKITGDSFTNNLIPETEQFVVLINPSKVTETDPLDKQMNKPLLLIRYPFFKYMLILNKSTQSSGRKLDFMESDV
jgi:hypothetical protein